MKRIHIVGSGPRTGTTLLHEAMSTCFEIDYYCEHEQSLFSYVPEGTGICLTKRPGEFLSVKWPLFFDKNLYVICIIRDPRDTIVSVHRSRPNEYWAGLKFWKRFTKIYEKLKKNDRFILIKYEDFTLNPDKVQDFVEKKVPFLQKKYNFSEYHKYANPSLRSLKAMSEMRPIEPKGIGSWHKHLPRVKQQIKLHGSIAESLTKFEYEKNFDWVYILNDVPDQDFYVKKTEFFTAKELWKKKRTAMLASLNVFFLKLGFSNNFLWKALKNIIGNRG